MKEKKKMKMKKPIIEKSFEDVKKDIGRIKNVVAFIFVLSVLTIVVLAYLIVCILKFPLHLGVV